jgi:hypothetical protein
MPIRNDARILGLARAAVISSRQDRLRGTKGAQQGQFA